MTGVVVPLDGSRPAEQALDLALPVSHALGARLLLLRVVPRMEIAWPVGRPAREQQIAEAEHTEAHRYVARLAGLLRARDVDAGIDVRFGDPAEEIVTASRGAAMVVMTTHGRGGLQRFLVGSVADRAARHALCPVLLVRPAEETLASRALRRIAVALDGSRLAETALPVSVDLATRLDATLVLVRVVPAAERLVLGRVGRQVIEELGGALVVDAKGYLEGVAATVSGARVETQVRRGSAAEQLLRLGGPGGVDLMVLATHGRGGIRRWALGSVALRVVHESAAPVLVVPAGARE